MPGDWEWENTATLKCKWILKQSKGTLIDRRLLLQFAHRWHMVVVCCHSMSRTWKLTAVMLTQVSVADLCLYNSWPPRSDLLARLETVATISIRSVDVQIIDTLCGFVLVGPTGALIHFLSECVARARWARCGGCFVHTSVCDSLPSFSVQQQIMQLLTSVLSTLSIKSNVPCRYNSQL